MKKLITTLAAGLALVFAAAQTPASSDLINYTGRIQKSGDKVSFDWSGVTAHIKFKGTQLSMKCSDTGCDYINVWIDKVPCPVQDAVIELKGDNLEICLCNSLKRDVHDVHIQKRTEGEQGCITIDDFFTDGHILQAEGGRTRNIEFVGDSYTCGFGTEGADRDQPFRAREENCNLAYGVILGRFFDADVSLVSHSGRGISRNYDDSDPGNTMVVRYGRTFDGNPDIKWDAGKSSYKPDIVVIYLGTNDFSTGRQPALGRWCADYANLLSQIRENYGKGTPILCVASKADEKMGDYVEEAVRRSGIDNVHWTSIQAAAHNDESELGSSYHPNYKGQRKVAFCMAPYISTLTGWELPAKPLE